jgi:hypothetical protein
MQSKQSKLIGALGKNPRGGMAYAGGTPAFNERTGQYQSDIRGPMRAPNMPQTNLQRLSPGVYRDASGALVSPTGRPLPSQPKPPLQSQPSIMQASIPGMISQQPLQFGNKPFVGGIYTPVGSNPQMGFQPADMTMTPDQFNQMKGAFIQKPQLDIGATYHQDPMIRYNPNQLMMTAQPYSGQPQQQMPQMMNAAVMPRTQS